MPVLYFWLVAIVLLILLAAILIGSYREDRANSAVLGELLALSSKNKHLIAISDLEGYPQTLSSYLIKTGVLGKRLDSRASFKQQGRIKTKLNGSWRSFSAIQYMSAAVPGFIWLAKSFPLYIRDKSINGTGEVNVNLLGLKNVAGFGGIKTSESALVRCLGELMFFPIGFLSEHIQWEELGPKALEARLKVGDVVACGTFDLDERGMICRFTSRRYKDDSLEHFTGIAENYMEIGGFYLPTKMRAIWQLEQGDFEYFNARITDYNID